MLDCRNGKLKLVISWKHWQNSFFISWPPMTSETKGAWLFRSITPFSTVTDFRGTPLTWSLLFWRTYFRSIFSMRVCRPRVWGWLWPWRRSTSCLRALSSNLRAATSFSNRQLSLSAMLIVSGSPARADSFIESSTDSSQASRLPRAWSTFTTYTVEKQRTMIYCTAQRRQY